jgi:hypothetical protein
MIQWDTVATVATATVVIVYPPLGIIWKWIRHTEVRFDDLKYCINDLKTNDTVDVRDLKSFKDDVGRRLDRIESHVWQ